LKNSLSGRYYGRFFVSGKLNWLNLDTDSFTVARLRLADERATIERKRLAYANIEGGTANMGEVVRLSRAKLVEMIGVGENTRLRYLQSVDTLCKTWRRRGSETRMGAPCSCVFITTVVGGGEQPIGWRKIVDPKEEMEARERVPSREFIFPKEGREPPPKPA